MGIEGVDRDQKQHRKVEEKDLAQSKMKRKVGPRNSNNRRTDEKGIKKKREF